MELIGWISSLCLACCGVPLALDSLKHRHSSGISKKFLWLWMMGEITGLAYCLYLGSYPLIFNYGFNILLISPVLYYGYYPQLPERYKNGSNS